MGHTPIALCFQPNTVAYRRSIFGEDDGGTGRSTNTAHAHKVSESRTSGPRKPGTAASDAVGVTPSLSPWHVLAGSSMPFAGDDDN
ncbi:hypothetical protein GCM10017600_12310 [Streptosporangium carneum]|uniref:Uncharacterized protein n=1 Tax=Streptosporangium carneum TaxID=47481 RepID=A0A9W6MB67_9ACTN|nr:hypothetical protein GCM10017600_12310 [Streptosporangium carneum]